MRTYQKISCFRLMDIEVIYEGEIIYSGKAEDAPAEIKNLKYLKIEIGTPTKVYIENQ